ncbi:hypothetical protein QBZ16_002149 [Prototheca wickerhamii]|uniref:Uncharacterized protein n=1 Tax=Prototheca wickerhamii TaxID=3111 RepID=A0AAD9MI82_PROWI|nr:hypothetical protein QBZ16_002149 [Prototheca wickerhamii]
MGEYHPASPHTVVHVSRIPSFVTQADVHRCFQHIQGFMGVKIMGLQGDGTQIAYADFEFRDQGELAAPPRMETQVRPLAVDPRRPTPPPASDSELPSVRVVVREDGSRAAFQPAATNRGVVDPGSLIDNLVQSGLAEQLISAVSQRQQQQQQQQQQQPERPQEAVYSASYEPVDPRSLPPPGMYSQARAPPREPDFAGPMRHAAPRFSAAVPAEAPSGRGELYGPGPGEELYGHPAPQPSLRLVTKPSKRAPHELYAFAFVNFVSTEAASDAAGKLQGYPLDLEDAEAGALQITYARDQRPGPPADARRPPPPGAYHPAPRGGGCGGPGPRGRGRSSGGFPPPGRGRGRDAHWQGREGPHHHQPDGGGWR